MKYYAYEHFKDDTRELIQDVRAYKPEVILGIARGGLCLAHCMAEGLDIRDVQTLRTELYDKDKKRDALTLFGNCELEDGKRVLVVDDIADSGETLDFIMKTLAHSYPKVQFQSATLFYKKSSIIEPNFWIQEANEWIDFFWERDFQKS